MIDENLLELLAENEKAWEAGALEANRIATAVPNVFIDGMVKQQR
jgi:hypothetical protein